MIFKIQLLDAEFNIKSYLNTVIKTLQSITILLYSLYTVESRQIGRGYCGALRYSSPAYFVKLNFIILNKKQVLSIIILNLPKYFEHN